MRPQEEADFRDFVIARSRSLRRTAYLLCHDWYEAEDIVQTALTRLYVAWRRVRRRDSIEGYVRRIIVRTYLDERRRGWYRNESSSDALPDVPLTDRWMTEERLMLMSALEKVPPRQRAVLVLRFWEDYGIGETAQVLGCSEGTVKSQTSRGLATLRNLLTDAGEGQAAALNGKKTS